MELTVFDYIYQYLDGEYKQTALEFVEFLHSENIKLVKENGYWKDKIYYMCRISNDPIVDNYILYVAIKDPDEPENNWTIWFEKHKCFGNESVEENVKRFAWEHIGHCGSCGSCNGGKTEVVFGESFDNVCDCIFRIDNAQLSDIPFLKELVYLRTGRFPKSLEQKLFEANERATKSTEKMSAPGTKGGRDERER